MNKLNTYSRNLYSFINGNSRSTGGLVLFFLLITSLISCKNDDLDLVEEVDNRDPMSIIADLQGVSYAGPAPEYTKFNVFNKDLLFPGFQNFRIPVLVSTTSGTLLAFSEMRTGGDLDPKTLVYRRSTDNGQSWSEVTLVEEFTTTKIYGNENVVVDENTGNIHLIYLEVFTGSGANSCNMYHKVSTDEGLTWSARKMIPDVVNARWRPLGPAAGIQLKRGEHVGRLLIPGRYSDSQSGNYSLYSDDGGGTWKMGYRSIANNSIGSENESTCVELVETNGNESVIYINSRDQKTTDNSYRRLEAYSEDSGESLNGSLERNDYFKTIKIQGDLFRWSATDQGDAKNRILFSALTQFLPGAAQHNRRHVGIWSSFNETDSWTPVAKRIHDLKGGYSTMVKTADGYLGILLEEGASNYFGETSLVKINEAFLDVPLIGAKWDFEEQTTGSSLSEGTTISDSFSGGTNRPIEVIGNLSATTGSEVFRQETAILFDGKSYLKLEDIDTWTQFDFNENSSFTIEIMVKARDTNGSRLLVGRPYQAQWPQWLMQLEEDGTVSFRIDDDDDDVFVKTTSVVADNKWHHVAAVRDKDSQKLKIYVDGQLSNEVTDALQGSLANRKPLYIGGMGDENNNFTGEIDFVRISPDAIENFIN